MSGIPDLSIRTVRAFLALAEAHSTGAAAEKLDLRPDALHARIRNLEKMLDCELVSFSSGWKAVLTEAGREALPRARAMEQAHDALVLGKSFENAVIEERIATTALVETTLAVLHRNLTDEQMKMLFNFVKNL